jgi:hypothetical protein
MKVLRRKENTLIPVKCALRDMVPQRGYTAVPQLFVQVFPALRRPSTAEEAKKI